jgi:hypothetical protein
VLRALPTVWLSEAEGGAVAAVLLARDGTDVVLLYRMLRRIVDFPVTLVKRVGTALDKHWWHTKKSRDSLGAALRSPGTNEAIAGCCR